MSKIVISDPTLRDGNHAVKHQLSADQIALYCQAIDGAGVPIVEVGHGNGIGASSIQVGFSKESDKKMLETARKNLKQAKLCIHCIPSFATINRDLKPALELGVDIVRVASHCTEADITEKHITFVRKQGKIAYGVLMMAHMASAETLLQEALKMESYGAEAIIIMDSAGSFLPNQVEKIIETLTNRLNVQVGYHGHNNLGMGVANSIVAAKAGATILDGTARCFGAGSGNTQLEVLVAVLSRLGYKTGIDLYKLLDASDLAEQVLLDSIPTVKSLSVVSGLAGVFSGFTKHVERISEKYQVDARDIFFRLGKRGIVAGQEDMILEEALKIKAETLDRQLDGLI
jgi:4-hydroxy 2-oxovalerate aldolase